MAQRTIDSASLRGEYAPIAWNYFERLVKIASTSDEESESCPSTEGQWEVARVAAGWLEELGFTVKIDENGYVMGRLASNRPEAKVKLGLIAHMDTAPDFNGVGVNPRIVHFDGDVALDEAGEYHLNVEQFPQMERLIGHDLVVTDGTSLLSADDKSGMAAILTVAHLLHRHPEWPHGELRVAFTPDEEIGRGAHRFNVEAFDADFAYTVDGGEAGELEAESFNAAAAVVDFYGRSVHPGSAKGKMINAQWMAHEFLIEVDDGERPEFTENREGFLHLTGSEGDVEHARLRFILRDFEADGLDDRKQRLQKAAAKLAYEYGEDRVKLELKDQYRNMGEVVSKYPFLIKAAEEAYRLAGVEPRLVPIRGGTDGSQLSFMGLPCPNLFTGGGNFHGRFEYLSLPDFYQAIESLLHLVALFSEPDIRERR